MEQLQQERKNKRDVFIHVDISWHHSATSRQDLSQGPLQQIKSAGGPGETTWARNSGVPLLMPQCNFRVAQASEKALFCDSCCQNDGDQAKSMGCSTLTKNLETLQVRAVVIYSLCDLWRAGLHTDFEYTWDIGGLLLLGPTAEAGPPWANNGIAIAVLKCPLMRERSLIIAG